MTSSFDIHGVIQWEPTGITEVHDRLSANFTIDGVPMHLEAIRVVTEAGGMQVCASDDFDETYYAMLDISGDGPLTELAYGGYRYVLNAIAFSQ